MHRLHCRIGSWIGAGAVLLGAAGAALAGERRVPEDYSTIQAAVNASASGDVVICSSGTYTEAVTATKSNITIQGASGAVWDGRTGSSAADCLVLTGDSNVVTGFTFKNGKDHCVLIGDDCKVKDCASVDAGGSFCVITGARARIEDCRADRSRGKSVKCKGDSAVVVDVDVYDCYDVGFDVEGDDCVVKYCKARRCDKGGFRQKGKRHRSEWCEAWTCAEFGFDIEVESSVFLGNYADDCGTSGGSGAGFLCIGSDNYFEYCDTYDCRPHGHYWKGHRNEGYDNWCDYAEKDGFHWEGDDNYGRYNQSRYCGRDGHRTRGDRNRYRYCYSYSNDDDGFDCDGGRDNRYEYCRGKYNDGAGCENGGYDTDVYGCVFLYNTVDIGLDGSLGASFDTFSLNTWLSGSATTILKIGLGL